MTCGCDFDSCGNLRRMCESCRSIEWAGQRAARLTEALEREEARRSAAPKRGWRWPVRWPYGDLP